MLICHAHLSSWKWDETLFLVSDILLYRFWLTLLVSFLGHSDSLLQKMFSLAVYEAQDVRVPLLQSIQLINLHWGSSRGRQKLFCCKNKQQMWELRLKRFVVFVAPNVWHQPGLLSKPWSWNNFENFCKNRSIEAFGTDIQLKYTAGFTNCMEWKLSKG